MRALCEGCGKPQPPDWKAGDLCSFCGKSVRHDVRCYWCAKWVPAAKFCRSCGATVVEERLYGAARMLKDAGTDRFTIPKQLKEFDPDQIENFARIYQRHAVAVARHVDELRLLERFTHNKAWSSALEEQLVPQLPWPEDMLARMSAPTLPPSDDLAAIRAIQETTPFPTTRAVAILVRLSKRDGDVYKEACSVFYTDEPGLKDEAALGLTDWRIATTWGRPRNLDRELADVLLQSPHRLEAAVRLGFMGRGNADLLKEALSAPDPETAFCAALVLGDVDRLQAALKGDDHQKSVAGSKLISLGVIKPVIQEIPKSTEQIQQELVESLLRRKEAAPDAAESLLDIVEKTADDTLRERASRLLCRDLKPAWVLRIARAAKKDRHIFQNLLQAPGLTSDAAVELADFLLAEGRFTMNQYGMDKLAEGDAMPASYVPTRFARATGESPVEMLHFAEKQLEARKDEGLHRFVMQTVFGPHSPQVRAAAWWALHRWYRSLGEHRGEGPFTLQKETIERFFGSVGSFAPRLAAVLRDRDSMKEVGLYEFLANLLKTADAVTIAAIQAEGAADDLLKALLEAAHGDYWPYTMESIITLASQIGAHPRLLDPTLKELRSLGKKGNYHYDKAVRRLELGRYGIPEESEWGKVPDDFATTRFDAVDVEGKRELLKLIEHQLIHQESEDASEILGSFLLGVALRPGDPGVREEAMQLYVERGLGRGNEFTLKKGEADERFGSYTELVALLPGALEAAFDLPGSRIFEFCDHLLSKPAPTDADELAAEKNAGIALIHAILKLTALPPDAEHHRERLRRNGIRFLSGGAGAHPDWRDEVLQALERIHATPGTDMAGECEMAIRKLKPPAAPQPRPAIAHPREEDEALPPPEPMNPEVADYMAKQKIAEKMGADLQQAIFKIMAGRGSAEKKMREATRLSEEFQVAIKKLYGQ
ncbi:MAG TPA: zinc ribbon domain-containing protein [Planctomycetota bacterium]|nr:zinc ribbon domain-containing protein [Planctomycetota bacterium]